MNPDEQDAGTADELTVPDIESSREVIQPRAYLIVFVATLSTAAYAFMWNSVTVALPHMMGAFAATTDQVYRPLRSASSVFDRNFRICSQPAGLRHGDFAGRRSVLAYGSGP